MCLERKYCEELRRFFQRLDVGHRRQGLGQLATWQRQSLESWMLRQKGKAHGAGTVAALPDRADPTGTDVMEEGPS
eukprot:1363654-Amphidinium_carterae.1